MDRNDASALADLQMHWDEAYAIGLDGDIWFARYHTSADSLRAHTSSELRELIRSDYAYRRRVDLPASDRDEGDGASPGDVLTGEDGATQDEGAAERDADDQNADDKNADDNDAARAPRQQPETGSYGEIRGERMSI